MDSIDKKNWLERNIDCFSSEQEAVEYLEKRLSQEKAKATRILRVFNNFDIFNEYAKTHKMGRKFEYDSDKHGNSDLDNGFAFCSYEYK